MWTNTSLMFLLFVCTVHDFYNIRMPFKHLIKMRLWLLIPIGEWLTADVWRWSWFWEHDCFPVAHAPGDSHACMWIYSEELKYFK